MDGNVALESELQQNSVFSADMVFNVMYFSHQLHTHSVSYFACQGRKKDTKPFLVTDIINLNTHFWVRNTYYDYTDNHTLKTQLK